MDSTKYTPFWYGSTVHLTLTGFAKRASCSQRIRYNGRDADIWHSTAACKRCFSGVRIEAAPRGAGDEIAAMGL